MSAEEENSIILDRASLSDELYELSPYAIAAYGEGRYVFVLGDISYHVHGDENIAWFSLDIVDLFFSERVRIEHVGDFYGFGTYIGFYALNASSLVLVDLNVGQRVLRQRLIFIDRHREEASSNFHRCYSMNVNNALATYPSAFGLNACITVAGFFAADQLAPPSQSVLLYPREPRDPSPALDITGMLIRAMASLGRAKGEEVRIANAPPIIISRSHIAFFAAGPLNADLSRAYVFDINTSNLHATEIEQDARFCFHCEMAHNTDFRRSYTVQNGDRQATLVTLYEQRRPRWKRCLLKFVVKSGIVLALRPNWPRLSNWLVSVVTRFFSQPALGVHSGRHVRVAVLCARTMRWRELPRVDPLTLSSPPLVTVFPNGQTLLYHNKMFAFSPAGRMMGSSWPTLYSEQFRILANPFVAPSLLNLASYAVRRSNVDRQQLQMLAVRFLPE